MNDSRWTTCCAVRAGTAEEGGMLLRQDSSITEAEEDHYGDGHKLLLSRRAKRGVFRRLTQ